MKYMEFIKYEIHNESYLQWRLRSFREIQVLDRVDSVGTQWPLGADVAHCKQALE